MRSEMGMEERHLNLHIFKNILPIYHVWLKYDFEQTTLYMFLSLHYNLQGCITLSAIFGSHGA